MTLDSLDIYSNHLDATTNNLITKQGNNIMTTKLKKQLAILGNNEPSFNDDNYYVIWSEWQQEMNDIHHKIVDKEVDQFVKDVNSLRLTNKNKWYYYNATVNGRSVQIKAYGTWLQVFNIDNINYSNVMDMSITDFKIHLKKSLKFNDAF